MLIDLGAVIFQQDLLMKFNTPASIGSVREEQFLARELYNINLNFSSKIILNYSVASFDICDNSNKHELNQLKMLYQ